MMESWIANLIGLYVPAQGGAKAPTEEQIELAVRDLNKRFPSLANDTRYLAVSNAIRGVCELISKWQSASLTEREQRRYCLIELNNQARSRARLKESAEIAHSLFEKLVISRWQSAEEKRIYERAAPMIVHWNDYFVSYTRRGGYEVNQEFMKLLKLQWATVTKSQTQRENLVAKLIDARLRSEGLRGFFDDGHIKDGDKLQETIEYNIERSFVLVQLLQTAAFIVPDEGVNWPFEEFKRFRSVAGTTAMRTETRFTMVGAGSEFRKVRPEQLDLVYEQEWWNVIINEDQVLANFLGGIDRPNVASLRDWFKERAGHIADRKDNMIKTLIDA